MNAFNPLCMSIIHLSTIQLSILTLGKTNLQAYRCKSIYQEPALWDKTLKQSPCWKKSSKSSSDCCLLPPNKSVLSTFISWIYSQSCNLSDDYRVMGFVLGINLEKRSQKLQSHCKPCLSLMNHSDMPKNEQFNGRSHGNVEVTLKHTWKLSISSACNNKLYIHMMPPPQGSDTFLKYKRAKASILLRLRFNTNLFNVTFLHFQHSQVVVSFRIIVIVD